MPWVIEGVYGFRIVVGVGVPVGVLTVWCIEYDKWTFGYSLWAGACGGTMGLAQGMVPAAQVRNLLPGANWRRIILGTRWSVERQMSAGF